MGTFIVTNPQTTGSINVAIITTTGSLSASSIGGSVMIGTLQGNANLGNTGVLQYQSLMAGSLITASSIASLTVDNNLAGIINVGGNLDDPRLSEGNMTGQVNVAGTLGSVTVAGATPGSFVAGHVGNHIGGLPVSARSCSR